MERLTLNAPAKINLGLNIVSKRSDGFHNLETLFYPVYDLHDTIIFENNHNFIFDSDNFKLLRDPDNLILKAHTLIEDLIKKRLPIKMTLIKKIPIGAGLGGGSSDAAATLLGLNEFFNLGITLTKLNQLALQLGSDVPFFINSKPSIGYSRGEILTQTETQITNPILIINPGIHIATKEAFANISPKVNKFDYNYFLNTEEPNYNFLQENLTNDFESYVMEKHPEIQEIKKMLIKADALFSLMTGTGSTVYGIFDSFEKAQSLSNNLPEEYFNFISE